MERTKLVVNQDELKIVEGKVVISSEELANAIQDYDVNCNGEDEANDIVLIQINPGCKKGASALG